MKRRAATLVSFSLLLLASASAASAVIACVDLFHSTEFTTLCSADAAACAQEASVGADSGVDAPVVPTIEFCALSAAESTTYAQHACAWLGACEGALEQSSFGACMLRASAAFDCTLNPSLRPRSATAALWSCLATVTSCAGVSSCLFGATPPTCGPATGGTFTACSQDNPSRTLVECGLPAAVNKPVAIEPCLLEGRSCATVDTSKAVCAGKRGVTCTGEPACTDGTFASQCATISGIPTDVGIDCAAFGAGRCLQDDSGVACAPLDSAESCTGSSKVTCDDAGVAKSCVGGKTIAIDCSKLALRCNEVVASPVNPLAACSDLDAGSRCIGPDECAGDLLRSCAQGKKLELSCSSVGLKSCAIPPAGRSPFAACTPP